MGEFFYEPEIKYKEISAEDDARVVPLLDPFKKGLMRPLEGHIINADGLRKFINNPSLSPEIRAEYRLKNKNIDDELAAIVRAYSELEVDLQNRQLEMTSQRDFYNYFKDHTIDYAKLEYIMLLKTYEYLKTFNMRVAAAWTYVQETFEEIKVTSINRQFLEQVLSFKVYPRLELCELTDLLLRRLAYLLQIRQEEVKQDKVIARGEYTSLLKYSFAAIFREDLSGILSSKVQEQESKVSDLQPETIFTRDTCIRDPFFLDSRGQELFNQSYLYTLAIKPDRKKIDEQKIRRSVYIETHLGAEENALRQDLIRKFISAARNKDRIAEYNNFLFEYFDFTRNTILLQFMDFSDLEKNLLIYHFGPVYFLKILLHFMREGRTGYIHRHLKKDQMVRELPFEYLKFILKDWWDEKVYTLLTRAERNSREMFERLVAAVKAIWVKEAPQTLSRIKADPALLRYFNIHDVRNLQRFLEQHLSLIVFTLLNRFLGPDFIYLPLHPVKGHR